MQKRRVNPTAIGIFVLGSVVIGVTSIILFSSQRWFGGDRVSFVCFFEDDVDGMQIGSKVKLKGVPIGEVKQILIRFKPSDGDENPAKPLIPIIIEVNLERLSDDFGVNMDFRDEGLYQEQIRDGLRASLGMETLITGILQVNLDYEENAEMPENLEPFTYRGRVYRRIPTLPSQLEQVTSDLMTVVNNISTADFKGVVDGLNDLLDKLNSKLEQFEVKGMNEAIASFEERMASPKIDEALEAFSKAANTISEAADAVEKASASLTLQLDGEELAGVLGSAESTFESLTGAVDNLNQLVQENRSVPPELERSLKEIGGAAGEIREFVNYLRKRPNALLWGRKDEEAAAANNERERKPWRAGRRR